MKLTSHPIRLLAAIAAAALSIHAQVTGRVTGNVVDASGASVPNATVNLYLQGGSTPSATTKTTSSGDFDFASIRPEHYRLTVESAGFAPASVTDILVDPSHQTSLPTISLVVGTVSTTETVTVAATTLDLETSEVAQTITSAQVQSLPVLDRQVSNLFLTQAGVTNSRGSTSINGLRSQYSDVTLDGVNVQDNYIRVNDVDFLPNKLTIGEVSEMTVSVSNPSFGSLANANGVSLTTPSGGNQYHGNLYWYNRNSALSANDWFNNQSGVGTPFLNLNQFGGAVGGPVKKDKLFFFSSYETYNLHSQSPETNTILTANARQGLLTLANGKTFDLLKDNGIAIDPVIAQRIAMLPTQGNFTGTGDNLNTTGYQFNARSNERRDSVLMKGDYNLSDRNSFSATYRWNRDNVDRPDLGTYYSVVPPVSNQGQATLFAASWRASISPTLTNEVRGGGNLTIAPFSVSSAAPAFTLPAGSISTPSSGGLVFTDPLNSSFLPQGRTTDTYNLLDNANWIHGKHSVGFGAQTQHVRVDTYNNAGIVPSYLLTVYSSAVPYGYGPGDIPGASSTDIDHANALLSTLGGLIGQASQSFNITSQTSGFVPGANATYGIKFNTYGVYLTDNYKLSRRITLNLGIRWDYLAPVREVHNLLVEPQLLNNNPVQTLLGNATLNFRNGDLYRKDLNNFAPNVGFAWDIFGSGKTVVRGGYNIRFANDDMLEAALITASTNSGTSLSNTLLNINSRLAAPLTVPTPTFQLPISTADNWIKTGKNAVEGLIDPNLATPYVQQWNFGIEQSVKGGMVIEARYQGNHGTKELRQIDFNQIDINKGGFLTDFKNARQNAVLAQAAGLGFNPAYNPAVAGSVALPFFTGSLLPSALTNTTVRTYLLQNQVGTAAQYIQQAPLTKDPNFSFFPNPNLLYSSELTNLSNSTYNAAIVELRKRTARGFQFQANYTFSKVLSDAGAIRGLEPLLTNDNLAIERSRAPYDLRHAFKLNHVVPIPFGTGHSFGGGRLNTVLGGWSLSGFLQVQSGPPVSILTGNGVSGRGTLNRGARSGNNSVDTNVSLDTLRADTGIFRTGSGLYYVNPANINPANGNGVAADGAAPFSGQIFFNPVAGTVGSLQRRILDGPGYWNYDTSLGKDTHITERLSVQFRADFFNVFNHPNFFVGDQNVNTSSFGKISSMFYNASGVGPRLVQFGLYLKF